MNIVILGPQASGKGTQAKEISKRLNLIHIESGKILRLKAETNPIIKEEIEKGILVDSNTTISFINEYIRENGFSYNNLLFDGFPRSEEQYNLLKSWLGEKGTKLDKVVYLKVSDKISEARISSRRTCSKCFAVYNLVTNPPKEQGLCDKCDGKLIIRDDDKFETVRVRLATFHKQTEPILALAKKDGILIQVNGERAINEITEEIMQKISK